MNPLRGHTPRSRKLPRLDLRWVVAALLIAVVVATTVLVYLATTTTQEVRQDAQGPGDTTLVEPIEKRQLISHVVTRGTVVTRDETPLDCTPGTENGNGTRVFTRKPTLAARITSGGLVAAINGRPVLALAGETPTYRDIHPGTSGPDVRQLQSALRQLGQKITDAAGVYGTSTQQAVTSLYNKAGFTPLGPTDEDQTRLATAKAGVDSARAQVTEATAALKAANRPADRADILRATIRVEEASAALKGARTASATQRELLALELSDAQAALARLRHAPDVSAQRATVNAAEKRLAAARAEAARVATMVGPTIPYCEIVFVARLPATVVAAATSPSGASDVVPPPTADPAGEATTLEAGSPQNTAGTAWATLASSALSITAAVPSADARGLRAGASVDYSTDDNSIHGTGRISSAAENGGSTHLVITPQSALPAAARGASVRVTAATASTGGAVLVAPIAAVRGGSDGAGRLTVVDADGKRRDVSVRAGLSADGFVEVTPSDPANPLAEGDQVVVSG